MTDLHRSAIVAAAASLGPGDVPKYWAWFLNESRDRWAITHMARIEN